MNKLWLVLFVALIGSHIGQGLPIGSSPQTYPHSSETPSWDGSWYGAVPALALVITAVGLLFGCTWCIRHKDCKTNEGADNQLFTTSATHLHEAQQRAQVNPEPANNNISEDNNNGPISLREMQNIANNNAAAYIVSENEERNRSRESVVEFLPLPAGIGAVDPLARCADWFAGDSFPRSRLQYLREIGRGWFGRVVEGEIESDGRTSNVAVKILNQNASLEDKARFLDEAKMYRDVTHENILAFIAKCLEEDPWILMFEFCSMDLQQYLITNRPRMAILNETGVPLRLMCDVAAGLAHLHARGYLYRHVSSSHILVRNHDSNPRAVLGHYAMEPQQEQQQNYNSSSEVCALGAVVWEVCAWGAVPPQLPTQQSPQQPTQQSSQQSMQQPPLPDLPCPYRNHLYQIMQLCWSPEAESRPTAAQVLALLSHLHTSHTQVNDPGHDHDSFERRWQRLKPNSIPKLDEHVAIVHAPSNDNADFTVSEDFDQPTTVQDSLSLDLDTAVSRSSSILSDRDPLAAQIKSDSLNNLHGSLEDVRNIYLTHKETPALECHQGNVTFEEKEDRSDSSMDPWLKEIIAGSHDDVSYYKDVSDVMKNLDNILNSEKTSSSESSHQASPSRDNLSLDCKREFTLQSSLVKSPGITNFQNILDAGDGTNEDKACEEEDVDRDTIGTLSHSFERHSDSTSQHTLANLTPDTPIKDIEIEQTPPTNRDLNEFHSVVNNVEEQLPKQNETVNSELPMLQELCEISLNSVSVVNSENNYTNKDCDSTIQESGTTEMNEIKSKSVENNVTTQFEQLSENLVNKSQNLELIENQMQKNYITLTEEPVARREIIQAEVISPKITNYAVSSHDFIINERIVESTFSDNEDTVPNAHSEIVKNRVKMEAVLDQLPHSFVENQHTSTARINTVGEDKRFELNGDDRENDSIQDANHEKHQYIEQNSKQNVPSNYMVNVSIDVEELDEPIIAVPQTTLCNNIVDKNKVINVPDHIKTEAKNVVDEITEAATLAILEAENTDNHQLNVITPNSFLEHESEIQKPQCLATNITSSEVNQNLDFPINNVLSKNFANELGNEVLDLVNKSPNNTQQIPEHELILDEKQATAMPDTVQNETKEEYPQNSKQRSDVDNDETLKESNTPKAFMDLINDTTSEIQDNMHQKVINSCLEGSDGCFTMVKDESTEYLDLPAKTETPTSTKIDIFDDLMCNSTPKADSFTIETVPETTEFIDGVVIRRLEQKYIAEISPPESPSKSHQTDTYDDNSSVLGPFESFSFGGYPVKSQCEATDLPKEELLAFSSNFSEMNLETPSPLRDVNFLKEVPDIPEDLQFDDIVTITELKQDNELTLPSTSSSSHEVSQATEKSAPPSTPPNSPGIFLVSTPQQKYLVDIDLNPPPEEFDRLRNEIELNQIELQITSKLAMAENENNMNIEYSGPLIEEGMDPDSLLIYDNDAGPERFLAGNLGSLEEPSEPLTLDEECVQALRNELELKLPLAQVASIEPPPEGEWSELPPPPELIVNYPGALSPIQEETRQQLSAYENDAQWLPSVRTDSSESYPEPCNNSTDEVTDLNESGVNDFTFVVHSKSDHNTYTLDKDASSSKRLTMSTDSLNGSYQRKSNDNQSPADDKTYTKKDDDELNCERISQVSPFLLSPTTDTSAPGNSTDNATALSTLMKTTVPTDARCSKPSDTQCLSKATSIDSCCSNDTLYNVEENFDDMALDPDMPQEFEKDGEFRERRHSCGSTYTIQESKSEVCETFSPDSITENNYTYTNLPRTDLANTTPSATKSDTANDLAYGTLPSYSNCATDYITGVDDWKLPLPELMRKSPLPPNEEQTRPSLILDDKNVSGNSPKIKFEPTIKKMDSVEITCLQDNLYNFSKNDTPEHQTSVELKESSDQPTNTAPFITSTPVTDQNNDSMVGYTSSPDIKISEKLDLKDFQQDGEGGDISSIANNAFISTPIFLEDSSKTSSTTNETTVDRTSAYSDFEKSALTKPQCVPSRESNNTGSSGSESTLIPSYSDFEKSALSKPQFVPSNMKSNQSEESGINSEDFLKSVQYCPQDLSSLIDASSMLLASERRFHSLNTDSYQISQSDSLGTESTLPLVSLLPSSSNYDESQITRGEQLDSLFLNNFGDEEMDQPHSIIITDMPKLPENNVTFDSHINTKLLEYNNTFNSHESPHSGHDDQSTSQETISLSNPVIEETSPKAVIAVDSQENSEFRTIVPEEHSDIVPENLKSNTHQITTDSKNGDSSTNCNGVEVFATEHFLSDAFEELVESNVDSGDAKNNSDGKNETKHEEINEVIHVSPSNGISSVNKENVAPNDGITASKKNTDGAAVIQEKTVTEDFLQNEKKFCQMDSYLPLLGDIRFTGPATDIMTTSFNQDSPTSPNSPEVESNKHSTLASELAKEWDSDTDSHSSNSSSGEFIWKDGEGREASVVPSTRFDHQRQSSEQAGPGETGPASGSGSECSGSEGDEVEFVPSSWDCSAEPAKSSMRTLQQQDHNQNKKRVVFKRQKYHCVYEYPREAVEVEADSPATYLPDLSTYCEWDPASAEEAELGYGQLFGAPNPLDLFPLRAGISFGADYEDDFFISSSARPFEALGIMSTSSQFFPGKHRALLEPPPSVAAATILHATAAGAPELDFTTPDSGVEDITPGSTSAEEDFNTKKSVEVDAPSWKAADSCSSSESVSPSSPAAEALGGLRHTRDKLKLDLPASPHTPCPRSPRHARVFNFVLEAPRRPRPADRDLDRDRDHAADHSPRPEPTFSTFGKTSGDDHEPAVATDDLPAEPENEVKPDSEDHAKVETVKGEGTVLDSGDEDSGIESSKATLERQNKTPNVSQTPTL